MSAELVFFFSTVVKRNTFSRKSICNEVIDNDPKYAGKYGKRFKNKTNNSYCERDKINLIFFKKYSNHKTLTTNQ